MSWYLKKEGGSTFGPVEEEDLQQWAADGRIAPEDQLSTDQENWTPAPELESLGMEWTLDLEDGGIYGPVHPLALKDLYVDGSVAPDTPLHHAGSETSERLTDVLMPLLIAQNRALFEQVYALHDQLAHREAAQQDAPTQETPSDDKPESLKALKKWEGLYQDERTHREESEERLTTQIKELRSQLFEAESNRDKLAQRLRAVEKNAEIGQQEGAPEADRTLMKAYQDLSESYDTLLRQFTEKTEALSTLMSRRDESDQYAEERIRQVEARLKQEREEAQSARQQLADLEKTHLQLVRTFREMNDRYIRVRQQIPPPATPPASGRAAPAPGSPPKPDAKTDWKPKVRLT